MEAARGRVLITVGDPNGIGPEVAVKAAHSLAGDASLRPVVIGDRHLVAPIAERLGARLETDRAAWGAPDGGIDFVEVDGISPQDVAPGRATAAGGRATIAYVEKAVELVKDGTARAIVACPHSETSVNASGRRFSGYPNLLAELQGTGPDTVFLMLVGAGLRIVHVTLHERLHGALERLTPDLIERAAVAGAAALRQLGIDNPRIGVFGINPHAGENGLFGDEDDRIAVPAVAALRARGMNVDGPEGADIILCRQGYDAFIAMYHDQGHIPVKLMAGRGAAAMSIGAGFLFSSVGHGAAFDIAGQDRASPDAALAAIRLVGGLH
ncbi:MAG: 4-hydroxythreonine-4-phosphate dehydrogenase PdxA [Oricola sp.]|jgi:4-hydroxythreonine-4-phosphate dehydrogenase|nr:4-hydroxythreonine-4-phosphate dehydrogenase PdxA [Oricola sp.]